VSLIEEAFYALAHWVHAPVNSPRTVQSPNQQRRTNILR
jgi:hypothetical protein